MALKCGIVGLPNVGKSTLFNALTSTAAAEAANFPFCTIEPNVGTVGVPDPRLYALAELAKSEKIIPTSLEFVDIAGLVKGASKGEGLGNQFLGNIREVDAIIHVVRCFDDGNVTHVHGGVDPVRDAEVIETELALADLESVEKRLANLQRKAKGKVDSDTATQIELLQKLKPLLEEGRPGRELEVRDADEAKVLKGFQLLTTKPLMYVCNVSEEEITSGNAHVEKMRAYAKQQEAEVVMISAAIEAEVAALEDEAEKQEFLESLGLKETGLAQVIRSAYSLLQLLTFFTVGPKEARAWTVKQNAKAPQAAGVIHGDFERGFICAETISHADYVTCKGEAGARDAGKLRQEGRDYVVKDGDVFHFRFNV